VGQALRSIREIDDPDPLLQLESDIEAQLLEFVSYRLIDGTECAFHQVAKRIGAGAAVFWDRWSLPRRLAERREFLNNATLGKHITHQIRAADVVHGIASGRYAELGSYSEKERALAAELGKLRLIPCPILFESR
jgi:hypothetical protein